MDGVAPLRDTLYGGACTPRCAARASRADHYRRQRGDAPLPLVPLSVPETRRLLLAMGEPTMRRNFRIGWSRWRRAHQAVAARCPAARHARNHGTRASIPPLAFVPPIAGALTEAEWARVRPLLPPQQPRTGRRRHDHRAILAGILSVVRGGGSWREIP